jgi:hypothetical protein
MADKGKGKINDKNEREDLAKLCRQREKLAKAEADIRAAEMRADFEKQLATIHNYNDHAVWQRAYAAAEAAVEQAQKIVEATLKDLGIPGQFAPALSIGWYGRGENAVKERRAELTRVAATRIDAITKQAKHQIEASSVAVQTRLLAGSLESDDARGFLESMPEAAALMPLFSPEEVRKIAGANTPASSQ